MLLIFNSIIIPMDDGSVAKILLIWSFCYSHLNFYSMNPIGRKLIFLMHLEY